MRILSFWEKENFIKYDFVIIGAGIVGLSTACSLKEKAPNKSVLILERGLIPAGASTRNAGFACFGSLGELIDYEKSLEEKELLELVKLRYQGLKLLRSRLGDKNIGYRENGSYEVIRKEELFTLDRLKYFNQLFREYLPADCFSVKSDKISQFGLNSSVYQAMVQNHFEGELDTGLMISSLILRAQKLGCHLLTGAELKNFDETTKDVKLQVQGVFQKQEFFAEQLLFCTNAFSGSFFPELDALPARAQVMLTSPVKDLKLKGTFFEDRGYNYFRAIGDQVLIGGGRQHHLESENTAEFGLNKEISKYLEQKLKSDILPGKSFSIAREWSGIMCLGNHKFPIIKRHSARVLLGVRMSSMGVATGSQVGMNLAELALGS